MLRQQVTISIRSMGIFSHGNSTGGVGAVLGESRALFSSRPGQPTSLNTYDKGVLAFPPPKRVVLEEAERMGSLEGTRVFLPRSPVPSHPGAYVAQRLAYRASMARVRKGFAGEWGARVARVEEATREASLRVREGKASRDAERALKRSAALEAQGVKVGQQKAAREVRRKVAASRAAQKDVALHELRTQWLAELEADARSWITPERVEEVITPALFSQKFGWQWEAWFQGKELKRQLGEDARRSRRQGQPLTEVVLPPHVAPFADDWESEDDEAALFSHPATLQAARDGTGRVRMALEAARVATRARGSILPEPAYDDKGEEIFPPGSSGEAAAQQIREARREGGVSLAELAAGKPLGDIVAEYEAWLETRAVELERRGEGEGKGNVDGPTFVAPRDPITGALYVDDGERPKENTYIDACVLARNVEALYYALVRKRVRLEGERHVEGLRRLESQWGGWMKGIEVRGLDASGAAPVLSGGGGGGGVEVGVVGGEEWSGAGSSSSSGAQGQDK